MKAVRFGFAAVAVILGILGVAYLLGWTKSRFFA